MKPLRTVGLIANPNKPAAVALAGRLIGEFESRGVVVLPAPGLSPSLSGAGHLAAAGTYSDLASCDVIAVLGGDGTLLHAVRELEGLPVPILGVNEGSLGFLTEISSAEMHQAIEPLLAGRYQVVHRPLLRAVIGDVAGNAMTELVALNDVVVDEGSPTRRAVRLRMFLGDEEVGSFTGDGLIVATPAGSTAYNLSAGGPILGPDVRSLVMTPICSHTMSVRPLVYPDTQTLTVEDIRPGLQVKVTADGQVYAPVPEEGRVRISVHPDRRAHLVSLGRHTYFEILRTKLRWGGTEKERSPDPC